MKQARSRGFRALTRWEGPRAGHEKSRVSMQETELYPEGQELINFSIPKAFLRTHSH